MATSAKVEATLTQGHIGRTLVQLTNPMVWGLLAVLSLYLVDTIFIAQLGTAELAAISFTFPVVMLIMNFSLGFATGTKSLVSRAIGVGDFPKVQRITTNSLLLTFILLLFLTFIGLSTMEGLFFAIHAPASLLPLIKSYMRIWYVGLPIMAIPMVGNAALNAVGDMRFPGIMMCFVSLLNLLLDPLLIFGLWGFPKLGMQGAALATIIAYCAACIASLWGLGVKKHMLTYCLKFKETIHAWNAILRISLPAAASQMIVPLTGAVNIWMLAHFNSAVVAAYGIVSRLEAFALIMIIGLSSSLGVFVGQNWGAGQFSRVRRAVRVGYLFAIAWGLAVALVFAFTSPIIPKMFNADPQVMSAVSAYLLIVPISYGATGCLFVTNAFLNAIGKSFTVAMIAVLRYFFLYIPLAMIAMHLFGPIGLFAVISCVNIVMAISVYFWSRKWAWFIPKQTQELDLVGYNAR
ncbi:MAG: MATE family efflux transporter [Waddliaceae bacterium]